VSGASFAQRTVILEKIGLRGGRVGAAFGAVHRTLFVGQGEWRARSCPLHPLALMSLRGRQSPDLSGVDP
jgi:hypothetical protein